VGVRGSRWSEAVCIPNSRCRALCIFHGDPEFPGTPEPDMHPELATAAEPCKSSGDARELPTPKQAAASASASTRDAKPLQF
jgi:hypothetical protein